MNILLLAGDGIGPEIMAEAEKVLAALALPVALDRALVGGAAYEATGHPLPPPQMAGTRATWMVVNLDQQLTRTAVLAGHALYHLMSVLRQ